MKVQPGIPQAITPWAEDLVVSVGNFYTYENVLYEALTAHTATATFDIDKFQAISTSPEVPEVVTDPGTTKLTGKDKNVKGNAASNDITIELTSAVGREYDVVTITKTDDTANTITIIPEDGSGETINGESSLVLSYQYQSAVLTSDGSNWFILASGANSFPNIVVDTTPPSDTNLLWFDTN